ncbi:folliculin-interacting protein 2 [Plutella xylostella]|uniref:folliculin-interacting protein 2 n=1 Tax=Plutella xylostella TaxID=51655 RepID=UPI0020329382|nr:folliculin-interacting protein 2 [Plutella xylostella]
MALFDKLFSTKRKLDGGSRESRDRGRSHRITPEQVRLLLFKECDWRGRKLLFDSATIEKVPVSKNDKPSVKQPIQVPYVVEVSNGYSYLYKGPAEDASALGEMIFGAVAINYKSVSLKIHIMDEPRRLLCTKLFCVPAGRVTRERPGARDGARDGSRDGGRDGSGAQVVPSRDELSLSFSFDRGDSGFYGEHSLHSSVSSTGDFFSMFDNYDPNCSQDDFYTFHSPPGRKLSTSSTGSRQRRASRRLSTRFELSSRPSLASGAHLLSVPTANSCDSQGYSNSSTSGTSDSLHSGSSAGARRNKLGLALLVTVTDSEDMDVIRKCVEHSPQLQALVCRLRLATIAAGAEGSFVGTLHQAATDAATWLSDLLYGPRLQPMWLGVVSAGRTSSKLAESLLSDLCAVLSAADTKHTNFFISTLLTHVLTYHLGWVTTVSPYDVLDPQKSSAEEPTRPYNALWAQLNDLCGSIGFPPRAAKTIISGSKNPQLVNRLLLVLTYFVRCGEVTRNEFEYQKCTPEQTKVISVNESVSLKRTKKLEVPAVSVNTQDCDSSVTVVSSENVKRSVTLANLCETLSSGEFKDSLDEPMTSQLRRSPTVGFVKSNSSSSVNSSEEDEEKKVLFVLGDDEKLVGLKNKSNGGKSVKKSSKAQELSAKEKEVTKENCDVEKCSRNTESPSKCCAQTLQHSKPIKHSGFKFEFDKYPQIVTNYMKSKNLELLDRHYIGKPGNLKLDNFQFDPTVVPPIQEERCEICYKCQLMESTLQTPTNASELEFMNDMPRLSEPQYAKETTVKDQDDLPQVSPKTFVRKQKRNTLVVNLSECPEDPIKPSISFQIEEVKKAEIANEPVELEKKEKEIDKQEGRKETGSEVKQVIEFPISSTTGRGGARSGFDASLLGGVTDHYVPDLVLQGTQAPFSSWESELKRDLDLTSYLNKTLEAPIQAIAIIGDTNTWEVRVVGRGGGGGMSALVGGMLDALPHMWRARVPAHQCLSFLEAKLREFCVLSKTLADVLMSKDFCDIATLTKSLNIDINDVPLLMAVATTHTPSVARRYGISYR